MMEYQNVNINDLILPTTIKLNHDKSEEIVSLLKDTDLKFIATADSNATSITFSINDIEKLNRLLQPFGISEQIDDMQFALPKVEKKENLIPFVNAVSNLYDRKLDFATNRIKSHDNHVKLLSSSLEKNTNKLGKLTSQREMLKGLKVTLPFLSSPINALIKRNEYKISRLQNKKIPKLQRHIRRHQNTIDKLNERVDKQQLRKSICFNLSSVIKSFGILNSSERSEKYVTSMTALNSDFISLNNEKISKYSSQINDIKNNWSELSAKQQINAQQKFNKLNKQIQILKAKNSVLQTANNDISAKSIKIEKAEQVFDKTVSSGITLDKAVDNLGVVTATTLSDKAAHIKTEQLDPIMDKDGDHIPDRIDSEFNPEVTRFNEEQDRKAMLKEDFKNLGLLNDNGDVDYNNVIGAYYVDHDHGDQSWHDDYFIIEKDDRFYRYTCDGYYFDKTFEEITKKDALERMNSGTYNPTEKGKAFLNINNQKNENNNIIRIVTDKEYNAILNSGIKVKVNSKNKKPNSIPILFSKSDEQAVKQIIKNATTTTKAVRK